MSSLSISTINHGKIIIFTLEHWNNWFSFFIFTWKKYPETQEDPRSEYGDSNDFDTSLLHSADDPDGAYEADETNGKESHIMKHYHQLILFLMNRNAQK